MDIDPTSCKNADQRIGTLRRDLADARDALDERLAIPLAAMPARVGAALGALRDECMNGVTLTFVEALAQLFDTTPDDIADSMAARDLKLVTGKHVVDALAALATDRRSRMRTLERSLPRGRPWSSARYFSEEEDADDVAVMVLGATGRDAESYADAAVTAVAKRGAEAAARCRALLDAGTVPPYGVDLLDSHHANCWRAHHALQIVRLGKREPRRAPGPRVAVAASLVGRPPAPPPELVIPE
jgi:hypothetical protein